MTEERKISERYRSLAREEPPRHVDAAILAAARRAAETRPAPLVVPSGRRRWYFPLAAAAIIVLAVAVTLHVEREQQDLEVAEALPPEPHAAREEQPAQTAPAAPAKPASPLAPAERSKMRRDEPSPAPEAGARAQTFADAQKGPELRAEQRAQAARESAAVPAMTGAASGFAYASPEQWLQGIADLKRQGRHEEAERQLAEFRKRYPNYRIPEAILEKFETR